MFTHGHTTQNNKILYKPNLPFPEQKGPLCYYFSLMRNLHIQGIKKDTSHTRVANKIAAHLHNLYLKNEFDHDNSTDDALHQFITDTDVVLLNLITEGEKIETADDFISDHSVTQTFAALLGFKMKENCNTSELTADNYFKLLSKHGPLIIDGMFGLHQMNEDQSNVIMIREDCYPLNKVNPDDYDKEHTILVIGCKIENTNDIYYLDPNFPNTIQVIPFSDFIKRVINFGNRLICSPTHTLKPEPDWHESSRYHKPTYGSHDQ